MNWLGNMQQLLLWKLVEVDQRYHFPAIGKTNFITRSIIETLLIVNFLENAFPYINFHTFIYFL